MAFLHSKVEVYIQKKKKKKWKEVNVRLHLQRIIMRNNILRWANQMILRIFIRLRDNIILYIARFLWDYMS